jgi:hypothetical protein
MAGRRLRDTSILHAGRRRLLDSMHLGSSAFICVNLQLKAFQFSAFQFLLSVLLAHHITGFGRIDEQQKTRYATMRATAQRCGVLQLFGGNLF